jgi:hypothetical protein
LRELRDRRLHRRLGLLRSQRLDCLGEDIAWNSWFALLGYWRLASQDG